jgi:Leucine-rich repeat (LRR) protein
MFSFDLVTEIYLRKAHSKYKLNIDSIDTSMFEEIKLLRILDLNDNTLSSIESDTFAHLKHLKKLSLSSNQISHMDATTFRGLTHLEDLNLSFNKLTRIEACTFEALESVKKLYLNNNYICDLSEKSFYGGLSKSLEELFLYENRLAQLEAHTFDSLWELKKLRLNKNQIKRIDKNALVNLKKLDELYLEENQICEIEADTFKLCGDRLKVVNLINNEIKSYTTTSFGHLIQLETLLLHGNILGKIDSRLFPPKSFEMLAKLNLSSSQIDSISSCALSNLGHSLVELNLESNNLTRIEASTFQTLSKLKKLYLNANKIQWVARQAFRGLVSLDELNMHDNKLVRIKSGTFKPLVKLKQLRLFINGIKSIEAGVFEGMVMLEELYVGKNKVNLFLN